MGLLSKGKQESKKALPPRRRNIGNSGTQRYNNNSAFRSGRTMAGTTMYRLNNSDRSAIKTATPREKMHHLEHVRKRLAWIFTGLIIACIGLAVFLWQFIASVVIESNTAAVISQDNLDVYSKSIQKYLTNNPTERLRFNLNHNSLNEYIIKLHPEISSVSKGDSAGFTKTRFTVNFRKPVVLWQVDSVKYFVDANGVSFTKNIYENPNVTIVDNSGVRYTPGTAIASARFLSFVGRSIGVIQSRGMSVNKITIPAGTSRQVEVLINDIPYPFILSIDRLPGGQVEDMQRVIEYFARGGRLPKYVDIRVKGKAFYRE